MNYKKIKKNKENNKRLRRRGSRSRSRWQKEEMNKNKEQKNKYRIKLIPIIFALEFPDKKQNNVSDITFFRSILIRYKILFLCPPGRPPNHFSCIEKSGRPRARLIRPWSSSCLIVASPKKSKQNFFYSNPSDFKRFIFIIYCHEATNQLTLSFSYFCCYDKEAALPSKYFKRNVSTVTVTDGSFRIVLRTSRKHWGNDIS